MFEFIELNTVLIHLTAELLSGFFSYWSAFNFNDNVLVSRTGTELPFTQFFEKDNMPDGRIRSFKVSY